MGRIALDEEVVVVEAVVEVGALERIVPDEEVVVEQVVKGAVDETDGSSSAKTDTPLPSSFPLSSRFFFPLKTIASSVLPTVFTFGRMDLFRVIVD